MLGLEGSDIRSVFGIALGELVKTGFADQKQAQDQRDELAVLIKDVG